jgi:two-component system sensor histidine kinase/response regulator
MDVSVPACDLTSALARMGGDVELLKRLVEIVREDIPIILSRLRNAIAGGQPAAVRHEAHSLKGLVSNLSAEAVSLPIIRLEQMGSLGELTRAPDAFKELEIELSRLDSALSIELAKL